MPMQKVMTCISQSGAMMAGQLQQGRSTGFAVVLFNPFPVILNSPPSPFNIKTDFGGFNDLVFILGAVSGPPGMSRTDSNYEPDSQTVIKQRRFPEPNDETLKP